MIKLHYHWAHGQSLINQFQKQMTSQIGILCHIVTCVVLVQLLIGSQVEEEV